MRRSLPKVTYSVKVDWKFAQVYDELVMKEFAGNKSEAIRAGMMDQLVKHGYEVS